MLWQLKAVELLLYLHLTVPTSLSPPHYTLVPQPRAAPFSLWLNTCVLR